MFHSISHKPGRVRWSHLVRLVQKDQAVILKSLNPISVLYNSARDNPNTSANPQHLDLLPVLPGTLPLPLEQYQLQPVSHARLELHLQQRTNCALFRHKDSKEILLAVLTASRWLQIERVQVVAIHSYQFPTSILQFPSWSTVLQ